MAKPPRELDDDELIARVRDDAEKIKGGRPLEENAPADLDNPPVDLDLDGVNTKGGDQ